MTGARAIFDILLSRTLIPEFCSNPSRGMAPSGFVETSNKVSDEDVFDILRGWYAGMTVHQGADSISSGPGTSRSSSS